MNLAMAQTFGLQPSTLWRMGMIILLLIDTIIMGTLGSGFWSLTTVFLSVQMLLWGYIGKFDEGTLHRFSLLVGMALMLFGSIAFEAMYCPQMKKTLSFPPHAIVETLGIGLFQLSFHFFTQMRAHTKTKAQ